MKDKQWRVVLVVVSLLVVVVFACERNVTTIEQITESSVLPAENCFGCHSDQETALVAAAGQWANSQHASGENINRNSSSCARCHTSEGFVELAATGNTIGVDNPTAIHCFTCHAPHSNGNFSLRITEPQMLQDGTTFDLGEANLCVTCHQSRRNVNTYIYKTKPNELSTHWGPHHSVQGDMLIGSNGYEYDDYDYGATLHRSATDNGCLDCHFEAPNSYFLGGHSFNMAHGEGAEEAYNTLACEKCHSDMEDAEDFNRPFKGGAGIQDSVATLVQTLETLLEDAGLIGYVPEEGAVEPLENVKTNADSAGAVWNWLMAEEDRSHGVHNPQYTFDLLNSAIMYLQGGFTQSPPAVAEK